MRRSVNSSSCDGSIIPGLARAGASEWRRLCSVVREGDKMIEPCVMGDGRREPVEHLFIANMCFLRRREGVGYYRSRLEYFIVEEAKEEDL